MSRGLTKFIVTVAACMACVVVLSRSGVISFLDHHLLLNYTEPEYWEYFGTVYGDRVALDIAENGQINLIKNVIQTGPFDQGFTITLHTDGSFTYSGANNNDSIAYIRITGEDWMLRAGSYILTDGINVAPISSNEIKVSVMARTFQEDGTIRYTQMADASDLERRFFTTDSSQYDDYYVQLEVQPGYSSEGITFYPMLTTYENRSDTYHPCLVNYTAADLDYTVRYDYYIIDKATYLGLSEETLRLLDRRIRYQHVGVWSTIDFGDGTGIWYKNNDPEKALYGELNGARQLSLVYGEINEIVLAPDD